MNILTVFN